MEGLPHIFQRIQTPKMAAFIEVRRLTLSVLVLLLPRTLFASAVVAQENITKFDSSSCYQGNCDIGVLDLQAIANEMQQTNQLLSNVVQQLQQALVQQSQEISTLLEAAETCCAMTPPAPTTTTTGQPVAGIVVVLF